MPEGSEREETARRRGAVDGLLVGAAATLVLFSAFFFSDGDSATGLVFLGLGAAVGAIAAVVIGVHVRSILRRARATSDTQTRD